MYLYLLPSPKDLHHNVVVGGRVQVVQLEQWNNGTSIGLPFELEAFFLRKRREKEGKGGKRRRRQNQHGELSASQALKQDVLFVL